MSTEHLTEWIAALRSGEYPQGKSALARSEPGSEEIRYCCLGVGSKVAGVHVERNVLDHSDDVGDDTGAEYVEERFGAQSCSSLAPVEFIEWLGVEHDYDGSEYDLVIDWPDDLITQGKKGRTIDGTTTASSGGGIPYWLDAGLFGVRQASGLNDGGFTFDQIADILDYFGIKEATS